MFGIVELPEILTTSIKFGTVTLPFSLLQLLVEFALPLLGILVLLFIVYRIVRRIILRVQLEDFDNRRALRWWRRVLRLVLIFSVFVFAGRLLGAELLRWTGRIVQILNQPLFTSGNTEISLITLLFVLPVFYLAAWLSRVSRQMVEHGLLTRLQLDRARQFSVLNAVRFVVMGLTIVIGLSIIGINLSSLAVLFGVLGIGLGFGLQDVVGNAFAGVIIIFSRPVKEGDRVLIDSIEGTVQQIKLIHTVVNTITNETIIIPNSRITGSTMHNYSYDDVRIIVCNTVQVSYNSDLDQVGTVLIEAARRNPWAVPGKEPTYRVWSFDDSGITVRICTWIRDAEDRIPAYSWTNLEIWRAFREHHVEIPFPQMDLHVKGNVAGPALPERPEE
ncbi:MAG: mechanosensitive ion channel [Spirochaeta sp.]|jgi:potassium efflux system protein|nr:mechanosensitive ion channel [Spirochaeta sp.]